MNTSWFLKMPLSVYSGFITNVQYFSGKRNVEKQWALYTSFDYKHREAASSVNQIIV